MAKKNAAQATRPPRDELKNLQASNQKLAAQYERQVNRALRESLTDFLDSYVDPRGALLDDNGELWQPIGAGRQGVSSGRWTWGFGGEDELFEAQAECRQLAFANEFAINGHENRISYIVGFGHQYSVTQKADGAAGDDLIAETKAWLDELLRENRWPEKQQETVRRRDRDGECFIRMFHDRAGMTRWRFIEPEQVKRPSEIEATEANTFGVVTDADDAETREGYYVDGEWIAAQEIQHRRANADSNRKRGVPLFYPVRKNLRRAEKLLRNMGTVAGIQAAVAWFEKITGAAQSTVQSYVASGADASVTNQTTGKTNYFTQYPPGSIIRKPGNTELEFPSSQVNPANFVPVLQAELRAVAARLCMPEWMLTSSADMANYASTMVGEGPAVRMFERAQGQQIADDLELIRLALAHAVTAGRLPAQALADVEIQVEPPTLAVRDVLKEVQADLLLLGQRIMSPQTVSGRNSLDYEQEQANIEQHDAEHPPAEREYLPPQPSASAMGDVSEAVLAYLREGRGDYA